MLPIEEYLRLRERPAAGRPLMVQSWRSLTFLHVSLEPGKVQAMLPEGLTVDTFTGPDGIERAWLGLVPFRMTGIRPTGWPALPWISAFPETNVRTYVHHEGGRPGVWFFSLDAARWLACKVARRWFGLPYWHGAMSVQERANGVCYRSRRMEGPYHPELEIDVQPQGGAAPAVPGTLNFFLVERYLLYALRPDGLWTGRVWHEPYEVSDVLVNCCTQSFIAEALDGNWAHTTFSHGVDVEVFGLEPVAELPNRVAG